MKKIFIILFTFLLFTNSFSQVAPPEAFNYQALARDNAGNILANQNVSFRMSILKTSVNGTSVYSEKHTLTTDAYGLANFAIGTGTVLSGVFANIDWSNDSYFIKVEFDPNGGNSFTLMGTSQFLSVPYALHAKTVDEHFDPQYPDGFDGETVIINTTYTVPPGKNLIINSSTGLSDSYSSYIPRTKVKIGNDTLWGSWNFIPENSTVTVVSPNNDGVAALLFDKKTDYVLINTTNNFLVPVGKKLYLYLPSWGNWKAPSTISYEKPGRFRIDGNNYINLPLGGSEYSLSTETLKLIILPAGSTLEYVDYILTYNVPLVGLMTIAPLPPRVFTGYLK